MRILEILNYRGMTYDNAPHEVEVRYKRSRYIVRAGTIVELVYGPNNERAEPTNLTEEDYETILRLAKIEPVRIKWEAFGKWYSV